MNILNTIILSILLGLPILALIITLVNAVIYNYQLGLGFLNLIGLLAIMFVAGIILLSIWS